MKIQKTSYVKYTIYGIVTIFSLYKIFGKECLTKNKVLTYVFSSLLFTMVGDIIFSN